MPEPRSHLGLYRAGLTSPAHRHHITVARDHVLADTLEVLGRRRPDDHDAASRFSRARANAVHTDSPASVNRGDGRPIVSSGNRNWLP